MKIRRFGILLTVLMAGGVGATAQTSTPTINGNVFGGGKMADVGTAKTAGTTATIVVNTSTVTGEVYGGNDITGKVHKGSGDNGASASVTVNNGTIKKVYGGANGNYDYTISDNKQNVTVKEKGGSTIITSFTKTATATHLPQIETTSVTINNTSAPGSAPDVNDDGVWKTAAGTSWGIGEAFGGGNNADVSTSTSVTVNNGYIKYVFGGNNLADMNIVPDVYIKHGYINKVYGGGNAGAMRAGREGHVDYSMFISQQSLPSGVNSNNLPYYTGTNVLVDDTNTGNTNSLYIGNVYGGCRAANVNNSTFVRITRANSVGKVFGGCDIAGSVGTIPGDGMVYASTYVMMNGATVGNIYGGGNGNYTYEEAGNNTVNVYSVEESTEPKPVIASFNNQETNLPFVTSSRLSVEGGNVSGNVYGGGNAAEVGHKFVQADNDNYKKRFKMQDQKFVYYSKSYLVGDILSRTSYLFLGKTSRAKTENVTIDGNVYGGGCMANIYGTMDIIVKSGMSITNLFAGNDAAGTIYGEGRGSNQEHVGTTNIGTMLIDIDRNGEDDTPWLSYGGSELTSSNAGAYIRVEDGATITNLFGGGNGDYTYSDPNGEKVTITTKETTPKLVGIVTASSKAAAKPTMVGTWVDMKGNATNLYGGGNAADVGYANAYITGNAQIESAYGGGNDATVTGKASITVDCNAATGAQNEPYNVQNLFGGNNIAAMYIVPSMQIKRGKIGTVYGGGNAGDMKGYDAGTVDYQEFIGQTALPSNIYNSILPLFAGTDVMIDSEYEKNADGTPTGNPCGLWIDNVYGGCRAANVDNSTYIRVTHADHVGNVFGGCDIAGSVGMKPGKLSAAQTFSTYVKGQGGFVPVYKPGSTTEQYTLPAGTDMLYAGTYVALTGGTIAYNMYGSGNGNYQYVKDGDVTKVYNVGTTTGTPIITFDNTALSEPFVTSSRLSVEGGTVNGNVYGGGLKAELGHVLTAADISGWTDGKYYGKTYSAGDILSRTSYLLLGSTQRATTTTVKIVGDVYGGGCLANVYGTMDIMVKAGVELKNLYAGNDAAGKVFGKNRGKNTSVNASLSNVGTILMDYSGGTSYLSYRGDNLVRSDENNEIGTYIRVEGAHGDKAAAKIQNIFGGGNGDYTYSNPSDGKVTITTKETKPKTVGVVTASSIADAKPVQQSTFLDIAGEITGSAYGGGNAAGIGISNICIVKDAKVKEAYGGGNSETVTNKANIWVDCNAATSNATSTDYNVLTVFGGNNKAEMAILPTIYLQCGKIGTVYGGGNAGKMSGHDAFALDFTAYKDNECLTADVVKTATVNGKEKTYLPMFSATEVLVDSPYKLDGTTKSLLGGSPSSEDLAKSCGLRINAVYGGCRAADVDNSTYTRITRADYVGNVYAGNDIAGTVGMNPGSVEGSQPVELVAYEVLAGQTDATRYATGVKFPVGSKMVNSGSYVFITGGQIDGNLFGGGNGDYVYTTGDAFSESGGNVTLPSSMKKPFSAASFVGVEGGTVKENVFGGGNKVDVGGVDLDSYDKTANPFYNCSHVFIGETARKMSSINLEKSVFGGGNSAGVVRNTHISVDKGSVIKSTLYGGCNSQGTVSGDSKIMVHSGTIGTEGSVKTVTEDEKQVKYLTDAVFGGGFGTNTLVKGNVYVNIKKVSDTSAATIYGNVYGGGNAGPVNTDCNNITETIVEGANIFGEVFGGGYGADVNGAVVLTIKDPTQLNSVEVTQADAKKTLYGNRVFATNNSAGEVKCDATLNFEANSCDMVIYGGGNKAEFKGNTNVVFTKGKVGYIYGGGNLANVVPKTNSSGTVIEPGNTNVYILGGEVCYDVFGGGKNGDVAGTANVYILDDRLTADGEYVVDKKNDGTLVLGTSGKILINPTTNLPYQPTSVTQSSIKIGGNVYGGGQNGNVGGKANVRVGK